MFRLFTLSFLVLLLPFLASSQGTNNTGTAKIRGTIIDSVTKRPIEYSTISLIESDNKKVINGTTSAANGTFSITGIAPGTYSVECEFIGYKPTTVNKVVISGQNDVVDLSSIALYSVAKTLQNVTVT